MSSLHFPTHFHTPKETDSSWRLVREEPLMKDELQAWPTTLAPLLVGREKWGEGEAG